MRDTLFPFQEDALIDLHEKIAQAHHNWSERNPQVISFSAPTGAGKTIIMTSLIEEILHGGANCTAAPDSVFVWLSDMPELNEQSRLKMESKSDKLHVHDLVTITPTFEIEYLEGGCVYFLNTQKLGNDKLLTHTSDTRQHTIWDILTNTAQRRPKQFYLIIDEAHRGANRGKKAEREAQSIMQKFVKGSPADGLCVMPLVIGVSATPQKFQALLVDCPSTLHKVIVTPEMVRESGLLKDRILFRYHKMKIGADMTMFSAAVEDWMKKRDHWAAYCSREGIDKINPILVVQVGDAPEQSATKTDLAACIESWEAITGEKLQPGAAVHTFNNYGPLQVGHYIIPCIEASRIEENEAVQLVFFKMNLSTGWDCPRAETMMSFRNAQDYTYIAQLLGRMIRTPLARHVDSDSELNSVRLFLPFFDESTLENVVNALRDNEAVFPGEMGPDDQLPTLSRNAMYAEVFDKMDDLVTYRVNGQRKQGALRRLIKLARLLNHDRIGPDAWRDAVRGVLSKMSEEIQRQKDAGDYEQRLEQLRQLSIETAKYEYGEKALSFGGDHDTAEIADVDTERLFKKAGSRFGEGLHDAYWAKNTTRDYIEVWTEIILLANDHEAMERLEKYAEAQFNELFNQHQREIYRLKKEEQRIEYTRVREASPQPQPQPWKLPDSIDFTAGQDSKEYNRHLFVDGDGRFSTSLNSWEHGVLEEELQQGAFAWLRNLPRKKWSLEIPYKINGATKPLFPDLIVVRVDRDHYVFDILEPHDPSLNDNWAKAVGLAEFAETHPGIYGRIQLIRKQRGLDGREHYYRLDFADIAVQNFVLGIKSDKELGEAFKQFGRAGSQ